MRVSSGDGARRPPLGWGGGGVTEVLNVFYLGYPQRKRESEGIIGQGCGVELSLSRFDHIIASSTKKKKRERKSARVRTTSRCSPSMLPISLFVSHLCKDLSPF